MMNGIGRLKTRYKCEVAKGECIGIKKNVGKCMYQTRYAKKIESKVSSSF